MSEAAPKPVPPRGSSMHLNWVQMCHFRLVALYRIAEGRQQHDDAALFTGAESLLARHGWMPPDFGFVDPPQFDAARMRMKQAPLDSVSHEVRARAAWKSPAGKRVVY